MKYWQLIGYKKAFACDECGCITLVENECNYDYIICHNCGFKFLTKWNKLHDAIKDGE